MCGGYSYEEQVPEKTGLDLKDPNQSRSVQDIGKGDYVKIGSQWLEVESNTAQGEGPLPKSWTVKTVDGQCHSMFGINRYAKREDLE